MPREPRKHIKLRFDLLKPGLHISSKDGRHLLKSTSLLFRYVGLYIVVMMAGIHTSQEVFVSDMLTALKPSLEHDCEHVLDCYNCMETTCRLPVKMVHACPNFESLY